METKPAWTSKTVWISLIVALAAFFPPVAAWIAGNPEAFGSIVGSVFLALRLITSGKISIT